MKKLVLVALAFSTVAATSALAATRHRAHAPAVTADSPTAVYFAGKVIGQDPDSFIRMQLLQDGSISDN